MFADVILPVPFESFTYAVPPEMEGGVGEGSRVLVGLGETRQYAGIVLRLKREEPRAADGTFVVKPILALLDAMPVATHRQLAFWQWLSDYYLSPLGDVYKAAFPGILKKGKSLAPPKRREKDAADAAGTGEEKPLTTAQQTAFDAVLATWGLSDAEPRGVPPAARDITLLHGVTSSGKTEIYIHLILKFIGEGKQVLYLLPEIALTTQIMERLRRVFGRRMGVYHSKFTERERANVYGKQLGDAPYDLILGARSSVFLPFQRLGLVIVDEEHEASYKQQEPAPRYHARSAAIMLARQFGAKTLLGTATPSFETYHLAKQGRYGYVALSQRFADMQLPEVEVVDIARLRFQKRMDGMFSPRLVDEVGGALARGEQVILFQNRRGYSPLVECRRCGWVPRCEHCDVSLTYHKRSNTLVCHYCGRSHALLAACPKCGCRDPKGMKPVGTGTERVEDQVARLFPQARVCRMDLDTATTRASYERIIEDFAAGDSDILIGTQMVSKGLDFDNVSVVGILDADTMLNIPDFRSYERTFQMLAQVAGRAGRKGRRGRVVLQTRSADLPLIRHVVANDYEAAYAEQMEERQLFRYPPFFRLVYVYLRHRDDQLLEHVAQEMAALLRHSFGERLLGPDRPPVGRVSSLHIRKMILKVEPAASASAVRQILQAARQQVLSRPYASGLNIYYDVDPM